jgi:hypothetical protein
METLALSASVRVLDELMRQGYTVGVKTRVDVYEHKVGPHPVTYAHKLVVRPAGLPDELREAVREHRDELLAAACVIRPPVPWLAVLVDRYLEGRATLAMLAANLAGFCGLHPAHDGARLEWVVAEVLHGVEQT